MARIVIIEDDDDLRPLLAQMILRLGHEVFAEPDGKAGLRRVQACSPDLVITDMVMPEKEGVETILELRRDFPRVKIIAISGGGRLSGANYLPMAKKLGAAAVLEKPFGRDELKEAVDRLLGQPSSPDPPPAAA